MALDTPRLLLRKMTLEDVVADVAPQAKPTALGLG